MNRKYCKYQIKCYNKYKANNYKCINYMYNRGQEKNDITMKQLEELVNLGAVLIDIRSPQEYKEGHLKSAIVIPEYELRKTIGRIIPNKNRLIVLYCGTGIRSKRAQVILQKMGYSNVYNLYKGTENY